MKNVIIILLIALFASACAPSEEVIQNAISQTQAAEISPTMIPAAKSPTQKPVELPTSAPTWTPEPVCGISSELMPEWNTVLCDTFEDNQWGWYEGNARI